MLEELPPGQATLRDEAALEIAILVIYTSHQIGVVGQERQLLLVFHLPRTLLEDLDRGRQRGSVELGALLREYVEQIFIVGVHLDAVVGQIEGQDLVVRKMVGDEGEILAHGGVHEEARVAKVGHPVVRVVVGVVMPHGIVGATGSTDVKLDQVSNYGFPCAGCGLTELIPLCRKAV